MLEGVFLAVADLGEGPRGTTPLIFGEKKSNDRREKSRQGG